MKTLHSIPQEIVSFPYGKAVANMIRWWCLSSEGDRLPGFFVVLYPSRRAIEGSEMPFYIDVGTGASTERLYQGTWLAAQRLPADFSSFPITEDMYKVVLN